MFSLVGTVVVRGDRYSGCVCKVCMYKVHIGYYFFFFFWCIVLRLRLRLPGWVVVRISFYIYNQFDFLGEKSKLRVCEVAIDMVMPL